MHWASEATFYHIYPLGALGAPGRNDFAGAPSSRLDALHGWLPELADLGVTAVYLGPVFESTAHGYDTVDYYAVDRRLGDNNALARFVDACRERGMRVVLDGVFNHVGRDFWAFRDVLQNREESTYRDWFHIDFSRPGPYGTPFAFRGWSGNYDLVKLNTGHPDVRAHLLGAVRKWIEEFGIEGLRLDAAAQLDRGFQRDLGAFCRGLRPDFWLMGEVVGGDYRKWANPRALDSVTNYVLYKALYSSHNDKNYFELAYALDQQSGPNGLYRDLSLYTFADNHDVDRVASSLLNPAHLFTLYGLLFTSPGTPSIYYGSEYGLEGRRTRESDSELRTAFDPRTARNAAAGQPLREAIQRLIRLRREHHALRHGDYEQLYVAHEQLAFLRASGKERLLIAANAASTPIERRLTVPGAGSGRLVDILDGGPPLDVTRGEALVSLYSHWVRVFSVVA